MKTASITIGLSVAFGLVLACSSPEEMLSEVRLETKDIAYTGDIRVSLAHPRDAAINKYDLVFSSSKATEKMGLCEADKITECKPGVSYYYEVAKLDHEAGDRRFFKPSAAAILEDGLVLTVIAMDASGLVIDSRNIKFTDSSAASTDGSVAGAGETADSVTGAGQGGPGTGQGGPTTSTTSAEIRTITQNMCGGGGCHPNYAENPESMKTSTSLARIQNGTMPRGRVMAAAEKDALIKYLSSP